MKRITEKAITMSRMLSWNTPRRAYYSLRGRVSCPICRRDSNIRDLIRKGNEIACKTCKGSARLNTLKR